MPPPVTRESVLAETLHPFKRESVKGVDTSTLTGKVMCIVPGAGSTRRAMARNAAGCIGRADAEVLGPNNAKVDLLPDVSELGADERFATGFTNSAGGKIEVYSPFKEATVLRHFEWMQDYGIDGVFVQRFIVDLRDPRGLRHNNTVLDHCRAGANKFGRAYAVMYDLSGLGAGRIQEVMDDWRELRTRMKVTEDPAYLHHRGRPLVTVWGVGFNDGRRYTLAECKQLVEFLKQDGCSVMVGVPTRFRKLNRDAVNGPELQEVIKLADVVSPWTVGRYRGIRATRRGTGCRRGCRTSAYARNERSDFLPVVYPGFSWFNMNGRCNSTRFRGWKDSSCGRNLSRRSGPGRPRFTWRTLDEMDEGATAISSNASTMSRSATARSL